MISFFVHGIPKAQPRPRAFARLIGGRPAARVYEAGTAEGWKGCVALAARPHVPAVPLDGSLGVDVDFLLPRPKRLMRRSDPEGEIFAPVAPDRDNLDKALLDALTTIGMWRDDAQVCDGRVRKLYHAKHGTPGARVVISTISVGEPDPVLQLS